MKQQITAITERVDSDKSGFDRADLSKPHTLKELLEEARRETFDTKGAEITEEPGELFGNALLIRKGDEEYSFTESLGVIEASEVFRKAKEKYPGGAAFYKAIEEDGVLATLIDMKGNELTELLKKHAAAEDKAESIEKLRVFFNELQRRSYFSAEVDELLSDQDFLKGLQTVMEEYRALKGHNDIRRSALILPGKTLEKRDVAMTRTAELVGLGGAS